MPGVEVVLTKRALMRDLAERLTGTVAVRGRRAAVLAVASGSAPAGSKLVPTSGIVEALRAVKDDDEIAKLAPRRAIADRAFEALTAETWIGRSERELAWRLRELLHAHGVDELSFDIDRRLRAERREAARRARRTGSSRRERSSPSTGARASTATAPTARARSRRAGCPAELRRGLRRLPRGAASRASTGIRAGHDRRRGRRARARGDRRRRLRRELRPRPRPRRRPRDPRGAAPLDRVDATRSRSATSSRSSRGSTCRASAACGSRISRSCARTASSC